MDRKKGRAHHPATGWMNMLRSATLSHMTTVT
jgi:hypothetical protein